MICYLCAHTAFKRRPAVVRDQPSLEVVECEGCGLVTLSSLEHIGSGHYEDSGMHGAVPPSIETWLRRTESDDQRRFEMLRHLLTNRKVLDFGCGSAGFIQKAKAVAASVHGVEPEVRVREHWGPALALHGSLDDAASDYDVITAFHVLEHLSDPRVMLQTLAARLAAGGRLVIEVPSADDALLTVYESAAFQRFTYWSQHLYLFNAETLRRVAIQAGLRVVAIQQFQRYPLSNHLYWLSRGQPGGHERWSFLDTPALAEAYSSSLAAAGRCDTIIAHLEAGPVS